MLINFLPSSGKLPAEFANLRSADLSSANLSYANLRSADLSSANLSYANLSYAHLSYADLSYANLSYADLSYANLSSADLRSADLTGTRGLAQQSICAAGTIYGYKKLAGGAIATLLIPTTAKRLNAYGSRKCRAEFAYVSEIDGLSVAEYRSRHADSFLYAVGATICPTEQFLDDPRVECGSGIHFFITREEAEDFS